ncbi:hypothetical protein SmJEL517_g00514 [Synchytrium microbalum]|uniref:J domain-containing protein n=1 Tax=Synchytrium microbalum TaxID=1806994 RepID=A0A507CJ28_9FUNG|nr:uncharacterized protein SmJEL517_g00514 [Synchytrium microbalum]TPX37713.1 hypothetical protein SmJEL517_g00514 [Synchytrium microbalum]
MSVSMSAFRLSKRGIPRLKCTGCLARGFATFDPYSALHCPPDATSDTIKRSYFKLVFDLHPDRQGVVDTRKPETATEKLKKEQFLRVVKAYEILGNPDKKKQYDLDVRRGMGSRYSDISSNGSSSAAYRPTRGWQSTGDDYYSYYYNNSGRSTGPRYMTNGRMAFLIFVAAIISGGQVPRFLLFTFLHIANIRSVFVRQMNQRDEALQRVYNEAATQARANGSIDRGIDLLLAKQRARGVDVDTQLAGASSASLNKKIKELE